MHAVNLLQLNLPLDLTQYCQSIATVLFIYIHIIHMYVCMHTRMHATLSTMKSSTPLPDCFLWGSVYQVKTMVSLCFSLKWPSPRILDTLRALFITHLCGSNKFYLLSFLFIPLCSNFIVCSSSCSHDNFI